MSGFYQLTSYLEPSPVRRLEAKMKDLKIEEYFELLLITVKLALARFFDSLNFMCNR